MKFDQRLPFGLDLEAIIITCAFLIAIFAGTGVAALFAAEADGALAWHQWRGPNRDGSVGGAQWPTDLDTVQPLWRVELGKGYSGPIVTEDRVFVVETVAGEFAKVRALGRATGEEIWSRDWVAEGDVPFFANSHGTWERSTPAYDEGVLYVGDMKEVLHALDGETGEELWTIDFPRHYKTSTPSFGFASSPLVVGGHLVLPLIEPDGSQILTRITKQEDGIATEQHGPCRFVPLIGRFGASE